MDANQDVEELYKTTPPSFGHAMLKCFGFDSQFTHLNSGSFGVLPTPVRKFCDDLTTEIEANPDRFYRVYAPERMREARARIAKLIGAETEECTFVTNTSMGITNVLRGMEWNKEDVILKTSTTYGAVDQLVKYICDMAPYPSLSNFELQFPISREEIIKNYRAHLQKLMTERAENQQTGKTVAVIDSISSSPGVSLPWKEMISICKEFGIWTVVDGAHSIGQELNINLSEVQPDFWVSNCHKWLYSKRSSAVLYVPKRNQYVIKSSIPTPASYASPSDTNYSGPNNFEGLFEWKSTADWVPWLSVTAALDFREWIGGEQRIHEYTHSLAMEGGKRLASLLQTSVMDSTGEHTLSMVSGWYTLNHNFTATSEIMNFFDETILTQWRTYAFLFYHNGKWWARCSAQIWNELSDFELVADALRGTSTAVIAYAERQKAVASGQ